MLREVLTQLGEELTGGRLIGSEVLVEDKDPHSALADEIPEDKHVAVLHHNVGLRAGIIDCEFRLDDKIVPLSQLASIEITLEQQAIEFILPGEPKAKTAIKIENAAS